MMKYLVHGLTLFALVMTTLQESCFGAETVSVTMRLEQSDGAKIEMATIRCFRDGEPLKVKIPEKEPFTFEIPTGKPVGFVIRAKEAPSEKVVLKKKADTVILGASVTLAFSQEKPTIYLPLVLIRSNEIKTANQARSAIGQLERIFELVHRADYDQEIASGFQTDLNYIAAQMESIKANKDAFRDSPEIANTMIERLESLATESRDLLPQFGRYKMPIIWDSSNSEKDIVIVKEFGDFSPTMLPEITKFDGFDTVYKVAHCSLKQTIHADDNGRWNVIEQLPDTGTIVQFAVKDPNAKKSLALANKNANFKPHFLADGVVLLSYASGILDVWKNLQVSKDKISIQGIEAFKFSAVSSDRKKVALGSGEFANGKIQIIDLASNPPSKKVLTFDEAVSGLQFDSDDNLIISNRVTGIVKKLDSKDFSVVEIGKVPDLLGPIGFAEGKVLIPTTTGNLQQPSKDF